MGCIPKLGIGCNTSLSYTKRFTKGRIGHGQGGPPS